MHSLCKPSLCRPCGSTCGNSPARPCHYHPDYDPRDPRNWVPSAVLLAAMLLAAIIIGFGGITP